MLLDKNISIEHLGLDIGTSRKEGYISDLSLSAIRANIQPSSPETTALYGGAYGKVYTIYTTVSGILETDRVTVSGTTQQFIIKGKQYYNYGAGQHGEYIAEEIL